MSTAIETVISHTDSDRREAFRWARVNQVLHWGFGVTGIIAGAVAGISATADWANFVTAAAGFLAAVLAALQTFVSPKTRADAYWRRVRELRGLLVRAQIAEAQEGGPTQDQLNDFAADLAAINEKPLMETTEGKA